MKIKTLRRKQARKQRRRERRQERQRLDGMARSSTAAASADPDELMYRAAPMGEPNEQERTVIATLATENPVMTFDRINWRGMVDEVLVASGGIFPEQLVLLDDHSRWEGSRSVYGSTRGIRRDNDRWRGTLHFARNAGDDLERVWSLVRDRHLTDVSIGYAYGEGDFHDIPPGRSQTLDGRTWTNNGQRTLRVVTNWRAREVSLTPIGADDQAKIGRNAESRGTHAGSPYNGPRETHSQSSSRNERDFPMNKILAFLHARGLSADVTDQNEALAWARRNLAGDLLSEFSELCRAEGVEFSTRSETSTGGGQGQQSGTAQRSAGDGEDDGQRTSGTGSATGTATAERTDDPPRTPQTVDQIRAERERIEFIRQMSDGVNPDVVQQAINDGWDTHQVTRRFSARENREQRSQPLSPAIHSRSSAVNLRTLQAAILGRSGISIESQMLRSEQAGHVMQSRMLFQGARADASWMTRYSRSLERGGATQDDEAARAVENAYQMQRMSMVDFCRAALDCEGISYSSYDTEEIIQRSFSTATVNAIFTTNFAGQLLEGFMGAMDTTQGWVREADLPNFQTVERIQMHKLSKLKKADRNLPPADAEAEAVLESYKLHRYAERFTVDEMDIIDDRFGALDNTPNEMGEAAREVRPDLVYSILLGNPTMDQDSKALFHADHGNLTASGAGLSHSALSAGRAAMANQTSNGRLLSITGDYVIVPETDWHIGAAIIGSPERRDTTASTEYGVRNVHFNQYTLVSDGRLDVGVTDPASGTSHAGQPGSWFMSTRGGRHAIEVGTLRGTGRAPVVRRYNLTEGRIGVGWLVIMYNAAKAIGYQGVRKSAA